VNGNVEVVASKTIYVSVGIVELALMRNLIYCPESCLSRFVVNKEKLLSISPTIASFVPKAFSHLT